MDTFESDLKELKRYAKGKLLEFLNQLFIDNNEGARDLLNGLKLDNQKIITSLKELSKADAFRVKPTLDKAEYVAQHIKILGVLLNKQWIEKDKVVKLCISFVKESNLLDTMVKKVFSKSFLEVVRDNRSAIAKFFGLLGLTTALTTGDASSTRKDPMTAGRGIEKNSTEKTIEVAKPAIPALNPLAIAILQTARTQLRKDYKWGRRDLDGTFDPNSWDCSSLVKYAFGKNGIPLEGPSRMLAEYGDIVCKKKMDFDKLKPGDLLFFNFNNRRRGHVGIYWGDGKMIHAGSVTDVSIVNLKDSYYMRGFDIAKRIIPSLDSSSSDSAKAVMPLITSP